MKLNTLKPAVGSKKVARRVGRGIGSGFGKTAGRGHKGQKSRAGDSIRLVLKVVKCLFRDAFQNADLNHSRKN